VGKIVESRNRGRWGIGEIGRIARMGENRQNRECAVK